MTLFGSKLQILVVIPQKNFDDLEYQEITRACKESKIGINIVSQTVSFPAEGMRGIKVKSKFALPDVEIEDYQGIVFIGGLGARDLFNDHYCHKLARSALNLNRIVGAIDVTPMILAHAELLINKKAVIHPTEESRFISSGVQFTNQSVVVDGYIITARDASSAREFADTIVGAILRAEITS